MIILEQSVCSGDWMPIPPPLIGKIDQTKYDVSSDGKCMKLKDQSSQNTNPIDNTVKIVTDSEFVKLLADKSGKLWDKATKIAPSLIQTAKGFIYKKTEELEKWWEEHKDEYLNSGGGSGATPAPKSDFQDCSGTYIQGCKSEIIKGVQRCLGIKNPTGNFGSATQKALIKKGFSKGFTDSQVNIICGGKPDPKTDPNAIDYSKMPVPANGQFENFNRKTNKMRNNKIISEQQTTPKIDLKKALETKCITTDNPWFTIDTDYQPKTLQSGEKIVTGKNASGDTIYFYDSGIVKNIKTNGVRNWTCKSLDDDKAVNDMVTTLNKEKEITIQKNRNILDMFNLKHNDEITASKITKILQKYINQESVSDDFVKWNKMVDDLFVYDDKDKQMYVLTATTSTPDFSLPLDKEELGVKYGPNLKDTLKQQYGWNNVSIYLPAGAISTATEVGIKLDTTTCNQILSTYVHSAFQYQYQGITARPDRTKMQKQINTCYGGGQFNGFKGFPEFITGTTEDGGTTKEKFLNLPEKKDPFGFFRQSLSFNFVKRLLVGKTDYISERNPYSFKIGGYQNESKQNNLKSLIKENLLKISEDKKNNTLIESRIIRTRAKILTENRVLKNKIPREKFFNEVISEALYLKKQGFDTQLLKEEFWGSLKGLFGEEGSSEIFRAFKEYMSDWLIGKLTSDKPNGWVANGIKTTINDIHKDEIQKMVDCDFITKKVSQTITNNVIDKIGKDSEAGINISGIVKNGLSTSIDKEQLKREIEKGVSKQICPALGDVAKKLEDKAQQMKKGAIRA